MKYDSIDIARVCHEANRALQIANGDPHVSPPWDEAPEDQRVSCVLGVNAHLRVGMTPEQSHDAWMVHKRAEGWVYGPVKDEAAKTHPCLVPYSELPEGDQVKDALFSAVVRALSP